MRQHSDSILESDRNDIHCNAACSPRPRQDSKASKAAAQLPAADRVIVGILAGFTESDAPLVDHPENTAGHAMVARTTTPLSLAQIGSEVVLTFEQFDLAKPIILGCLQPQTSVQRDRDVNIELDGQRLTFSAEKEIVLSCGEASITLTRAGKILIRGAYLLSRSSGVNRIKGGSVQIN